MRYIDTSSIVVPDDWLTLAKQEFGNNYQSLWSYFRNDLEGLVGKKCWYSESVNIGAINPIDHFRPKASRVKALTKKYATLNDNIWLQIEAGARNGYPFLEFEFMNYRYSCYISNSSNLKESENNITRGKSNFFPLQLGSGVGTNKENAALEIVTLLDPCVIDDPKLLTFNEYGKVSAHKSILNTSWEYCKVMVSIELYHLHYYQYIDWRKEVWDYCRERIYLANAIYIKPIKTPEEEASLKDYLKQLEKKINKKADFSAVAIDCIEYYKNSYSWLDSIFYTDRLRK